MYMEQREQQDFVAWSLYTGPSKFANIIDDPSCYWVLGAWDGVNQDTSSSEIKKDIDMRIGLVMSAFEQALPHFKTPDRHFVLPEFFFRCKQGPYPNVPVEGEQLPFEYIINQCTKQILECIPKTDDSCYSIVIGSVLTSNVEDYTTLLNLKEVQDRLEELNNLNLFYAQGSELTTNTSKSTQWRRIRKRVPHYNNAEMNTLHQEKYAIKNAVHRLNVFMEKVRHQPLCTVSNKGAYFYIPKNRTPEVYVYEKQNNSMIDLTMGIKKGEELIVNGITEWMCNYPSQTLYTGDKHHSPYSRAARFSPSDKKGIDFGVEVCLDHSYQRLRRTVGMIELHGAYADNYPLHKQIISSGSCQIYDYSVATHPNSVIFNADGCAAVDYDSKYNKKILEGKSGTWKGVACGVYTLCTQSKWQGKDSNPYYSHSQLAFTTTDSFIDGFDNKLGVNNLKAHTYTIDDKGNPTNPLTDSYEVTIIEVKETSPEVTTLFAAGAGELHYYGPQ